MKIFGKQYTGGKLAALIFFILASIAGIALLFAGSYFGGQMKLIDKYYKALERGDYSSYASCISADSDTIPNEALFEKETALISGMLDDPENFRVRTKFKSREDLRGGAYLVTFSLTVYNDSGSATDEMNGLVIREGGKWRLLHI